MARDTTDETALTGVEELAAYLAEGSKPKDAWRIGTEHEKFPSTSRTTALFLTTARAVSKPFWTV